MAWDARNLISTQVGAKTHPDDAEPTEIWPTNAKVNAVNRQGLERLKDPPKRFEHGTWVRPFKNIPPYISVDEVTHALKTCDFIKSAPAPSNAHCCLSPRNSRCLTQVQQAGRAHRRPQAGRAHPVAQKYRHAQ